ncbi:MAG: hypothetical protein Q4F82_04605 [bacterium]|nr:MAG: hypothetical protein F082_1012 [bacterium F082]KWW27964.1 MAG: hypothetical protein AUK64_1956 [bacterium P201]MDO5315372.1 hypothetical protein [bacterium]
MKKRFKTQLFAIILPLIVLPLCAGLCKKNPDTCHQSIKVVNNSDRTVSIRRPALFLRPGADEEVWLPEQNAFTVTPKDTAMIQLIMHDCLEEYSHTSFPLYVLPDSFPCITTTWDSLYIAYDILKTIDLQDLGVDSLVKTDFTVYYP